MYDKQQRKGARALPPPHGAGKSEKYSSWPQLFVRPPQRYRGNDRPYCKSLAVLPYAPQHLWTLWPRLPVHVKERLWSSTKHTCASRCKFWSRLSGHSLLVSHGHSDETLNNQHRSQVSSCFFSLSCNDLTAAFTLTGSTPNTRPTLDRHLQECGLVIIKIFLK